MDEQAIVRVERCFATLAPRGAELVDRFFTTIFVRDPGLRQLFPAVMRAQNKKFLATLVLVVKNLRHPEALREAFLAMGRRHAVYGATEERYEYFRNTLLEVIGDMAGGAWNEQLDHDWRGAIECVASAMIAGQRQTPLSVA
jgi:hemoglobin-like flavoprotein